MSCNRYQLELSLNLDGRLPSGRREILMDHLAECDPCADLWDDLQRAQELVLRLPTERIGTSFHDSLWERIQAGEGTPAAVFHSPMPMGHKVRYVLTGAAAAAVVLFGVQFMMRTDPTAPPLPAPGEVAINSAGIDSAGINSAGIDSAGIDSATGSASENPPATDSARVRLRSRGPVAAHLASFEPVKPLALVEVGQHAVRGSAKRLAAEIDLVDPNSTLDVGLVRRRFGQVSAELRDSASLVFWLQQEKIIELPIAVRTELETTLANLQRLEQASDASEARVAMQALSHFDAAPLQAQFQTYCCDFPADFPYRFQSHVVRNPGVIRFVRIEMTEVDDVQPGGHPSVQILMRRELDRPTRTR